MGRLSTLLDTNILFSAFRRAPEVLSATEMAITKRLSSMLVQGEAGVIGPIRQEVLTGIRHVSQFDRLRYLLDGIKTIDLELQDFDEAARLTNVLLTKGITVSPTDSLLAAAALRRSLSVYTLDADFQHFSRLGLALAF